MTEEERKAIENLIEYIKEDEIYNGIREKLSDFDKFCISHCTDIVIVLEKIKQQQAELEKKDMQINLIYDFLYKFGCKFSGSFMKALSLNGFDIDKCDNCKYKTCNCKKCIKRFFERKVKDE